MVCENIFTAPPPRFLLSFAGLEGIGNLEFGNREGFKKNIARIENCCPENFSSVVKYVKLLFSKTLTKKEKKIKGCIIFCVEVV